MIDFGELRQEAFKCPVYRKLENQYLRSIEPKYDLSSEAIDVLEDLGTIDSDEKLAEHQTNKQEQEKQDEINIKLRDDHLKVCTTSGCKAYHEATKEFKN